MNLRLAQEFPMKKSPGILHEMKRLILRRTGGDISVARWSVGTCPAMRAIQ
jgi:hypothetical protein